MNKYDRGGMDLNQITAPMFNMMKIDQTAEHLAEMKRESMFNEGLRQKEVDANVSLIGQKVKQNEYVLKNLAEQEKIDNSFVPVSSVAPNILKMPNTRKHFTDALKSAGFEVNETPDGEVFTTNKALKYAESLMTTNSKFGQAAMQNTLTDLQQESIGISQQIAELSQTGKPDEKKLAPLLQRKQLLSKQIADVYTGQADFQKELVKQQFGNQTEEQLTARALRGDQEAQAILDSMQKRKLEYARQSRPTIGGGGGAPLPANMPEGVPGQKNERALQGVSAGDAAVIKQLAEYKIPLPSGMALRTPYWQNILGRTALYDPTFDATQYNVRMGVKRDFTSGTSSKTALSLNTAIGHLESLAKAADELDNSSFTPLNSIVNRIQPLAGDPRVKKLNTTANAVAGELATVFKNTSGTDQEIKSWREQFSAYDSPRQIKEGGVNQAIELIGSRLGALRNKYEQGLGKPIDFQILSPKSRRILKSLGADVDALDPGGANMPEIPQRRSTDRPPLSSFQR